MMRNVVLAAMLAAAMAAPRDRSFFEEKFLNWMKTHDIEARDGSHFVHMLENFIENDNFIAAHNAGNHTYTVAHNKFSHMNRAEWSKYVNAVMPPADLSKGVFDCDGTVPDSIDWTTKGAVTPVKDQGQCGSCWSFSTTGALEGAYYVYSGELKSYSEQFLVDCDHSSSGCNGGLMVTAYDFVNKNGIPTEDAYPYNAKEGTCKLSAATDLKSKVDFEVIPRNDACLMAAITKAPAAVAIEADKIGFQLYSEGVFSGDCGTNLNHAVLAVGYGTLDGADYYKVKNSWGSGWGQDGYILLARGGKFAVDGQCGILNSATHAFIV